MSTFSIYNIKIIYLGLLITSLLGACNYGADKTISFADNPVVAHRGAWKTDDLPPNSIAALKKAIELRCTGSEFDVRMTADDVLIVTHDPDYNEMGVEESTYAELSKVKLANGEILPTLREYILAGMNDNDSTGLVCEIKPSKHKDRNPVIAKKVLDLVEELSAENYILSYISFSYKVLETIEELQPTAVTQYLDGSKSPSQLQEDGIDGLDYYFTKFQSKPDWVSGAIEKGLILNAWTVNNIEDIDWVLTNGFNYITTDEPLLTFDRISDNSANK